MLRQVSKHGSMWIRSSLRTTSSSILYTSCTSMPWLARSKSTFPVPIEFDPKMTPPPPNAVDLIPDTLIYDPIRLGFPFQPAVYEVPGKHSHGKRVSEWMYKHLEELMDAGGGHLDYDAMSELISMLSQCNYYREAMEALQFSRQNNCKPHISSYSKIISACYNNDRYELAIQVFDVMRRDGFIPSFVTYSRALSSATKANQHQMVLQLFRELMNDCTDLNKESQGIACNTVLNSCSRNDDYETASWIINEMRERHLPLTQSTYNSYILCVSKGGNVTELKQLIEEMNVSGAMLTSNSYLNSISACARWKKWDTVIFLYEKMRKENQSAYVVTIAAAMMAYVKQGMPEKTMALYDECMAHDIEMNTFGKQAVITALLHLKLYDEGLKHCDEMMEGAGKAKDYLGLVYKLKVQLLIGAHRIDEAIDLLEKSKNLMDKTINCYRPLIAHYVNLRQYDVAVKYCDVLFETNQYVAASDWLQALSVSIALPDKSKYWEFRRAIEVRGTDLLPTLPPELILETTKTTKSKPCSMKKLLSPKLLKLL